MTSVYISGPMEGVKDYEIKFKEAEYKLITDGCAVINPAVINGRGMTREELLELDIELLDKCDVIYMLKGWQQSRGANREYGFALGRGIATMFE